MTQSIQDLEIIKKKNFLIKKKLKSYLIHLLAEPGLPLFPGVYILVLTDFPGSPPSTAPSPCRNL